MPAVSVSSLEDVSIQKIHKQIGVISLPPAVRADGTRWNKQKLIQEFGFPVLSKEIARKIELLQNPTPNNKTIRHAIDKMWDEEGDLTCRALVETYHKVKGKKLPWDDYKTPRFDDEAIQAIRDVADKYDIPVELITKLIVSVDTNKHITKNNKMQKAFDSIIGQGWLHYNSVEGALNHED